MIRISRNIWFFITYFKQTPNLVVLNSGTNRFSKLSALFLYVFFNARRLI